MECVSNWSNLLARDYLPGNRKLRWGNQLTNKWNPSWNGLHENVPNGLSRPRPCFFWYDTDFKKKIKKKKRTKKLNFFPQKKINLVWHRLFKKKKKKNKKEKFFSTKKTNNSKQINLKSQCHTKRRIGTATRTHPSFGMTPTQAIRDLFVWRRSDGTLHEMFTIMSSIRYFSRPSHIGSNREVNVTELSMLAELRFALLCHTNKKAQFTGRAESANP